MFTLPAKLRSERRQGGAMPPVGLLPVGGGARRQRLRAHATTSSSKRRFVSDAQVARDAFEARYEIVHLSDHGRQRTEPPPAKPQPVRPAGGHVLREPLGDAPEPVPPVNSAGSRNRFLEVRFLLPNPSHVRRAGASPPERPAAGGPRLVLAGTSGPHVRTDRQLRALSVAGWFNSFPQRARRHLDGLQMAHRGAHTADS